ncbi:hypothetical protein L211DRAFT_408316 [Terfezia boudieri ATCC MYA-4762]|uniref:Uncharacterized protein n=1 Tax=Terfezia boudieri ATCC MYA-4762 TaxID=1051890 RepID=A0A3N4LG27_9PEZI|nr:hypothetical protein L211DRAFT_408316 [Terfezia boudieri ATCC MYA-4762]
MLSQTWAVYFVSLTLFLGSTTANPIKIYEIEEPDNTPSNILLPRVGCPACTAGQAEYIYPTEMTAKAWKWKRTCINLCKAGTTLTQDSKTKKYECTAANCKRAGTGTSCALPKCNPKTQDPFQGKCVPKCTPGTVRDTTGKCTKAKTTAKCTAKQELLNGKCVAKCTPPAVRNAAGKCSAQTTKPKTKVTKPNTMKCKTTQELVNGKCMPKCKAPQRRIAGVCR